MTVTYSIVIPCHRSAASLPDLVARTVAVMGRLSGACEIVLVNDASPDATWRVIEDLARTVPEVRGFDLLANVGQFRATLCGLAYARGEVIVTMDDDLQHRPEDIPLLVARLLGDDDVDCVVASFPAKRHDVLRNLGSALYHRIEAFLYGRPPTLRMTAFRAMRRTVAQAICEHRTARPVIAPILLASAARIVNVEVTHDPRRDGRSGYSFADLVRVARDTVVMGSTAPLRMVSAFGFVAAVASVLLLLWYALRWSFGHIGVRGFTTEVLLIIFFGGCTLFAVGILGEYVARILAEVASGPRWTVRSTTSAETAPEPRAEARTERGAAGSERGAEGSEHGTAGAGRQ